MARKDPIGNVATLSAFFDVLDGADFGVVCSADRDRIESWQTRAGLGPNGGDIGADERVDRGSSTDAQALRLSATRDSALARFDREVSHVKIERS